MRRPNILFIMADQFRADALGCLGGDARTPHLDALAARGWLFTNAYANSAECIPSRFSLATGLYPHQIGVTRNGPFTLDPAIPNWMQAIEAAGYATSLFGKTHLHPHGGDLRDRLALMHRYGLQTVDEIAGPRASTGTRSNMTDLWDRHGVWADYRADFEDRFATRPFVARPSALPLDLYYDSYVGRTAREHIERSPTDRPWFCWVSFGGPHEPWDAPEPYASLYKPADMWPALPKPRDSGQRRGLLRELYDSRVSSPSLSPSDVAAMRANYAGNVTLIDDEIGRIIAAVTARGERDNTVILFTSDHGEMNGDHGLIYKGCFLDAAIKIPLIVAPAGGTHPVRSDSLVELLDAGATLADYAQAEMPALSMARSLRPLMTGATTMHRAAAVSEFRDQTCVVTPRMKVEFDAGLVPVLAFDRTCDPYEQTDISFEGDEAARIGAVGEFLIAFQAETPICPATTSDKSEQLLLRS